jgi:MinD-like ATPase involved in chromosome partitioning or flagellar assembly
MRSKHSRLLDMQLAQLEAQIKAPPMAPHPGSAHVVVACPKGGTGKTTTAAMMGLQLAELRGEITVVVDANPHRGTLRQRLMPLSQPAPDSFVRMCEAAEMGDLAPEWSLLAPYTDMNGRLRIMSNVTADPTDVELLGPETYDAGISLLRRAAQIVISDMGTSTTGEVALAALESSTTLVIATELSQDALELTIEMTSALAGAPMTYRASPDDWSAISDGRFLERVSNAVVVISPSRDDRNPRDLTGYVDWFAKVCQGGVFLIPRDRHLAAANIIIPTALAPETTTAFMAATAAVAAQFRISTLV